MNINFVIIQMLFILELSKNQMQTSSSSTNSVVVPVFIASNKVTKFYPNSTVKYQSNTATHAEISDVAYVHFSAVFLSGA